MLVSEENFEKDKKEILKKIDEWVTKNPNESGSSDKKAPEDRKIPVPLSPVENDRIKSELNAASGVNSADDVFNILKNNQENIVNSTDKDLQKAAKKLESKLGELDKEKSVEIIKGQIQTVLEQEKIKGYDLPVPILQKYSELDNNNNNAIRDEIIQEIGNRALEIMIVSLERILQGNNKTEIKNKEQELRNFVDSEVNYRKQAVQACQAKIDSLFQQTQQKLSLNENDSPSFFRVDNLLLYVFGIALVGTAVIFRKLRSKRV